MPYFPSLNEYLHQSSLLIQAYPDTRITTRYSLPRKPRPGSKSKSAPTDTATDTGSAHLTQQQKRDPSATLTLKTYHPGSGICLKYQTDKAAEVGRLMTGLGRLAKGEIIEMPAVPVAGTTADGGDKMEVDGPPAAGESGIKVEDKVAVGAPASQQTQQQGQQGGGAGGKKKKKGKK